MRDRSRPLKEVVRANAAALDEVCAAADEVAPVKLEEWARRNVLGTEALRFAIRLRKLDPQIVQRIGDGTADLRHVQDLAGKCDPAYSREDVRRCVRGIQDCTGALELRKAERKAEHDSHVRMIRRLMFRK
jgi:hypothetical protein